MAGIMSAASRLPAIAGTLSLSALAACITTLPSVREFLVRHLGEGMATNMWRIAALAFALANLKNLPGFWHIRVLRGILYQLYLQPSKQQPRDLFKPLITSTRNTIYDCDYNFHKSNSTYFADLDVARAHTMGCIIRTGLARLNRGDEEGLPNETRAAKGKYIVALGGVSCFFQRQIEPMQAFEIHTRVLSWDRKWLYLVSHIVKKGAVKPEKYTLQPWKRSKRKAGQVKREDEDLTRHIFATSIARYVFKKGRLTLNPEVVLERSRLLPRRPVGTELPPRAESGDSGSVTQSEAPTPALDDHASLEAVATQISARLEGVENDEQNEDEAWTWDDMEKERLRGLKMAKHFDALSGLHNELRDGEALGVYSDYW